jgi:hypothetical protein
MLADTTTPGGVPRERRRFRVLVAQRAQARFGLPVNQAFRERPYAMRLWTTIALLSGPSLED